ncbi:MAG: glycosyltransferase family 39 protein [Chloroflexi bacterium]|nr:glycosyltransferase family 39 protein [Chloroflexota bacterium]
MSAVFRRFWPAATISPETSARVDREGRVWLVGLLALFAIAVFLVVGIRLTYLYPDEYLVYRFTRDDLGYTVTYLAEHDIQGPLWFALFWGWRQLAGTSEFAGRMLALLFSLLTLAVLYQIGRNWFGAARAGVYAMLALTGMNLFFQFALGIRPYALALLLASLSMFSFYRWVKAGKVRWGVGYAVTVAAMLYVHYFLSLLVLIQALVFAALFVRQPSRRLFRQALGLMLLVLLLWSPWLPSFLYQIRNLREAELIGGNARGVLGVGTTTVATSLDAIWGLIQAATNGQAWLYAIVLLAGVVLLWRRTAYRLALAWALGLPAVAFLINTVVAVYAPRYILSFILGLALALGAALAALPLRVRWLALVVFTAISLWALPSQLPKDRIPYRDIVATFAAAARAGDALFYDRANESDDVWKWEVGRQFAPNWGGYRVKTVEEAIAAERVWFITADWLNPAVQANFYAIEATHPLQQVIGDCNRYWCFIIQLLEKVPSSE